VRRTATKHALIDERSTNPASSGIEDTLTLFSMSALVTLKSAGSNWLAQTLEATALRETTLVSFIVGVMDLRAAPGVWDGGRTTGTREGALGPF
jgi:hypothetical protein